MDHAPGGEPGPLPPDTLRGWLMDVAEALDFIHRQNYLHRDVKPDNILFDRAGNAFLADFGIIKMLAAEGRDLRSSAMTAPGFLVGTPNYVAPEVVMGAAVVAASDQYSLAMTVYEVLLGKNPMEGPTPSATLVNQTKVVPPALIDVIPGIPRRLSDAVRRGLSKSPGERFDSCIMLAREILAEIPAAPAARSVARSFLGMVSRGAPGQVSCPVCNDLLGVGRELAGQGIRCKRCQATLRVAFDKPRTITLIVVGQPSASWSRLVPEDDQTASGRTGLTRVPARGTGRTSVALPVPGPGPLASNDGGSRWKPALRRGIAYGLAGLRWKPALRRGIAYGLAGLRWKPALRRGIAYGLAGLRWKPALRRGIAYGLAGLVLVAGALFLALRVPRARRRQHRLWHRKEEVAGIGARGVPSDARRPADPGQPGRHGVHRGRQGDPRRGPVRSRSTSGRPPAAPIAACSKASGGSRTWAARSSRPRASSCRPWSS